MTERYFPKTITVGSELNTASGSYKDWSTSGELGVLNSSWLGNPNWRRLIRERPVVTGALTASWVMWDLEPSIQGYVGRTRNEPWHDWTPSESISWQRLTLHPWNPPEGVSDKALNQALQKLTSRYRESTQACQGLVVLGELAETLQFLMKPGRGIQSIMTDWLKTVKPYRFLKPERLSRRTVGRMQRNLRDQWLETSYALRPLLSEAEQAAQYFNQKRAELETFYNVFKATGTAEHADMYGPLTHSAGWYCSDYWQRSSQRTVVKFRGACQSTGSGPTAKAVGFDPTSWAPSLWNLIPYSFIVDYFSNLGQVVDTWAMRSVFTAGLQQTIWNEVETQAVMIKARDIGIDTNWAQFHLSSAGSGEFRKRVGSVTRRSIPSLPIPQIRVRCPNTSTKWINMIALVDAFYQRKTKK